MPPWLRFFFQPDSPGSIPRVFLKVETRFENPAKFKHILRGFGSLPTLKVHYRALIVPRQMTVSSSVKNAIFQNTVLNPCQKRKKFGQEFWTYRLYRLISKIYRNVCTSWRQMFGLRPYWWKTKSNLKMKIKNEIEIEKHHLFLE